MSCSQCDAVELRAWRYLATHRVGRSAVGYVEFIDGPSSSMRAPLPDGFVASCSSKDWGAAAIALAYELGMKS